MKPNLEHIKELMKDRGWSSNELARRSGISKSEVSRFLRGQRCGGNKMISGLLRAFEGETLESLFILPRASPNINAEGVIVPEKNRWKTAAHPDSSGIACRYNEGDGVVEIARGRYITTLHIPPGTITPVYSYMEK